MKKGKKSILGLVALCGIVAMIVAAGVIFLEKKKKDEAALEEYLDCSVE